MLHRPLFIGSEIYRHSRYGGQHPLAIARVSAVMDLARALGWLPVDAYVDSPQATPDQLARFHDRDYIAALMRAETEQFISLEDSARYNIGRNGNPLFREVFSRPATACGGTLLAAELLRDGGIVYSPAGGTHHGRRGQASGFCYFNDPVLGILALLDQGLRVLYVDVDAHHADGVQDGLAGVDSFLMISIHEANRWPFTGAADDRGGGNARNLPVPPGFNDTEFAFLIEEVIAPLATSFKPGAVVLQCGCDGLADDPLSKLALSNRALWRCVRSLRGLAPRTLVLGGGGYNPWAVARCWTGVWATLADYAIPDRLSGGAEAVLRGLNWHRRRGEERPAHWFTTLADAPHDGPIRAAVRAVAEAALAP
jgi:acetoin utilization protein AcuC